MTLWSSLLCVIVAGAAGFPNSRSTDQIVCETRACRVVGESIQRSINKTVDPCTDFYEYGCGLWPKNNPIPSDDVESSTFQLIHLKTTLRLKKLLEEKSKYDNLEPIKKLKQYYRSCMDEEAIENQGLKFIQSMLDVNGGWPIQLGNQESSIRNYTWQKIDNNYVKMFFTSSFFEFSFLPEEDDSSKTIFMISQGLTSYLEDGLDKKNEDLFSNYRVNKIVAVLKAFKKHKGIETPLEQFTADVIELFNFQQNLENISEHETEIRKGMKNDYDRMTIAELQKYYNQAGAQNHTAQINWLCMIQQILKSANKVINSSYPVLVENKHLFRKLAHLLDVTPPHVIVNYVQWNLVNQFLPFLTKQMRDIQFEATYMTYNVTKQKPRWKVCINDIPLRDALSVLFIKKYISPNTITAVTEMLNDLKAEMKTRILNSQWTNNNMKKFMTDKIDNIISLIGYPSWYNNKTALIERYDGLKIGKNYIKNKIAVVMYDNHRELVSLLKTIERSQWFTSPITVNAFYSVQLNSMVLPAAVIQDPLFTSGMPLAVNYGAIGMIVGHELAHSFDTTGIEYDKFGNKISSDAEMSEAYEKRVNCFIDQYSNYTLVAEDEDGEPIQLDGLLTKDENIADNIGLEVAFAAFQKRKLMTGPQPKLPGLTDISDEQLFFLASTNIWCSAAIETYEIDSINTDEHSPSKYRILGTMANLVPFSNVFNCPVNSSLNQNSKCTLWK